MIEEYNLRHSSVQRICKMWLILVVFATLTAAQNGSIAAIPQQLLYYIPASNFSSVLTDEWANGTTTTNSSINALLRKAAESLFISYTDEFLSIIGDNPSVTSIACPENYTECAYESGVWIPTSNEVWFSASTNLYPDLEEGLVAFNLNNNSAYHLNTSQPLFANGGYLYNGSVWFASQQSYPGIPSTIFSVNVETLEVTPLINSYFGIPFPTADEPVWVTRGNESYMFFTGVSFSSFLHPGPPPGDLPNEIWRFDPQTSTLQPVIDRTALNTPNGIRVSPDQKTLYITNSAQTSEFGGANGTVGTPIPGIYKFDLDDEAYPVNGRLWGLARTGLADGIHVDDTGRVWTGEGGGIVVRNSRGKVLGEINTSVVKHTEQTAAIANFALAGNKVVIGAFDHAVVITLNETVVASDSMIVN